MGACVTKPEVVAGTAFRESRRHSTSSEGRSDTAESPCEDLIYLPVINVDPPAKFHPDILITAEELSCRKTVQNLQIRSESFVDAWEKSGFLSVIHNHILGISSGSLRDLAQALTHNSAKYVQELRDNFDVAVAKAYAIYFWISNNIHYDTKNWGSGYKRSPSALDTRKGSSHDYASLFNALCAEAGLNAQKIEGNLRRWRSLTGHNVFSPDEHNYHCWNVVTIEDRPLLIDCTLGSGYTNSSFEFVKLYSRHYFMVPPQNLIFTHWPSDPSKQFLQPPLSLQDLQPIIPIPVTTQCLGVCPFNWSEVIKVTKESVDPVASVSFSVTTTISYVAATLVAESCSEVAEDGDSLKYHTLVNKVNSNEFNVQAVLPTSGKFVLNIYLNEIQDGLSRNHSLSYIIECEICQHEASVGYPYIYPLPARAFDFVPKYWNNKKSYVNSSSALFSLVFEASSDVAFHLCLIRGKTAGPSDSQHSDVYHHQTLLVNNKNRYKLQVIFPDKDWWTVCIAGTRTSVGATSGYTSLLIYHVFAEEGSKLSYPQVLMPGTVFFSSNPITASKNELTAVPFTSVKLLNVYHYLTEEAGNEMQEGCSNIELADEHDDQGHASYVLNLVFPRPGTWFVHVYSTQSNGVNEGLFKLKITVDSPILNTFLIESNALLLREYEMSLVNNGIVIFPDDGQPLSLEFVHHSDGVEFVHELKSPHNLSVDYCTYLSQQLTATSTLSAVFPSSGKWTVELFAKKNGKNALDLVLQLKLDVKVPVLNYCYPKIYPAFSTLGCELSKDDALVKSPCNGGEFKLPFQTSSRLYFFFKVENETAGRFQDFSQQAFVHASPDSENKVVHLIFPEHGHWKLSMYAKRLQQPVEAANEAPQILQIALQNDVCVQDTSFPLLFEAFLEPFELHFDPENLPLPLVVQMSKPPQSFSIIYYSPPDVQFMHYAEVRTQGSVEEACDETIEHVHTRMMSSNTGLRELQVEVVKAGHWTVLLYASNTDISKSPDKWTPVMQYVFSAASLPY